MVYSLRMLFFGLALLIAARPDLDNPGCYRDGWDYFRGVCEAISLLFFLSKIYDEVSEIIRSIAIFVMFVRRCLAVHNMRCFALQFPKGVLQGLLQLPPAACSDLAFPDYPFPSDNHMVCLHWSRLLCTTESPAKLHQFFPGNQLTLYCCITRPVDLCLTCLHGQCHSGH